MIIKCATTYDEISLYYFKQEGLPKDEKGLNVMLVDYIWPLQLLLSFRLSHSVLTAMVIKPAKNIRGGGASSRASAFCPSRPGLNPGFESRADVRQG